MWVDTYGVDSAYDYDPVWQKCRELGVPPSFHSGSMGWGSRMSYSSYMHNHIGQLNEGNHAVCKSLFLGGVTRRFPDVSFAFMEGGVAWAAMLFVDLIGHWEKRHIGVLDTLDPAAIDSALLGRLRDEYGGKLLELAAEAAKDVPANQATRAAEDPSTLDEWAACQITSVEDIRDLFVPRFFFGCEADDPMTSTAFNPKVNPFGALAQRGVRLGHRGLGRSRHVARCSKKRGRWLSTSSSPKPTSVTSCSRTRCASTPAATRPSSRGRRSKPPSPPNVRRPARSTVK